MGKQGRVIWIHKLHHLIFWQQEYSKFILPILLRNKLLTGKFSKMKLVHQCSTKKLVTSFELINLVKNHFLHKAGNFNYIL